MENKKNVLMLIGDCNKLFVNQIRKKSEENNLSNCYHPIIFNLIRQDGLTQLEIVKLTRLKAPTISLTLQKMELEQLVIRKQDPKDARQIRVYLTEKGRAYDDDMRVIIKKLETQVLGKFNKDELKTLEGTLTKLINVMSQEFGE